MVKVRFEIPEDLQDIAVEERLTPSGGWEQLGKALYVFGADVADLGDGYLSVECEEPMEGSVRSILQKAGEGAYGPEAGIYFSRLVPVP